jgi:hypothetical protein
MFCVCADIHPAKRALLLTHMTPDNCAFKSVHSYNIRRALTEKYWEGSTGRPVKAKFIVLVSTETDKCPQGFRWVTDKRIKPKHIYTCSHIRSYSRPGREGYYCDWNFSFTYKFDPPIMLNKGVGRGEKYAGSGNGYHLRGAYECVCSRLLTGNGCTLVDIKNAK